MNQSRTSRPLWIFLILIILFVVPIFLAIFIFNRDAAISESTTNHGKLIKPPIQVTKLKLRNNNKAIKPSLLRGRWVMLYIPATQTCDKVCQKELYYMRQIRIANGKNRNRILRVITTVGTMGNNKELHELLKNPYAGPLHLTMKPGKKLALDQGYLYIIDPIGNVMMRYSTKANPSDILKDMQRLLRISQIG